MLYSHTGIPSTQAPSTSSGRVQGLLYLAEGTRPNPGVVPIMFSTSVLKLALHDGRNTTLYGVILVSTPDRSAVQYKVNMDVFLPCLLAKGGKKAAKGFMVVYHLHGKTGWSTVEVNGTRQIPNGNFHGDALVSSPRLFPGR